MFLFVWIKEKKDLQNDNFPVQQQSSRKTTSSTLQKENHHFEYLSGAIYYLIIT